MSSPDAAAAEQDAAVGEDDAAAGEIDAAVAEERVWGTCGAVEASCRSVSCPG